MREVYIFIQITFQILFEHTSLIASFALTFLALLLYGARGQTAGLALSQSHRTRAHIGLGITVRP